LNVFDKKDTAKLIEFVMKENEDRKTALHYASKYDEQIVNTLLKVFDEEENKKLIEFVMKEDKYKNTALHNAASTGRQRIVNSLLNVFDKKDTAKLIEYLMKENEDKKTALHYASHCKNEKIVNSLLNVFDKEENEKLICEYLMKKDKLKKTALYYAYGYEQIVNILENKIMVCNLQTITQYFKSQKDYGKTNLGSIIFDDNSQGAKENILPFLIHDYNKENHKI